MIILKIIFVIVLLRSSAIYVNGNNINRYIRHVEDLESELIPVAIVTEGTRQGKAIDSTLSESINVKPSEKSTVINKNQNVLKLTKDFTVKPIETESGKPVEIDEPLKIGINADLQIPVAVVYDVSTTPNTIRKGSRRRKIANHGQKPNQQRLNIINPRNDTSLGNENNEKINSFNLQSTTALPKSTSSILLNSSIKDTKEKRTRERDPVVPIIESENQVYSHNGVFHYSYEGGDGTKAFENGELKSYDDDKAGEAVVGGFSYTGKDGQEYSLSYTADENGYRPVGAHLPTPPPIPPAIERALRYLATKTTPEDESVTDSVKKV